MLAYIESDSMRLQKAREIRDRMLRNEYATLRAHPSAATIKLRIKTAEKAPRAHAVTQLPR